MDRIAVTPRQVEIILRLHLTSVNLFAAHQGFANLAGPFKVSDASWILELAETHPHILIVLSSYNPNKQIEQWFNKEGIWWCID